MSRIFRSLLGVVAVLPAPAVAGAGAGCSVGYAWKQVDATVHQATLVIGNTGSVTIKGWTLRFTLPAGQKITLVKGASLASPSEAVVAHDIVVNATVEPGGSVTVTYRATGAGGTASGFTVNEVPCS
ncbi:cellulose binding domain-containing protein [Actinoplanes subglobosus]|uniref:Cellulose binding domain-containing protein n=1 Tax=Actinoplanes subglobosus TaxID=1547892 RepID=A0ABV8J6B8_9ACTN